MKDLQTVLHQKEQDIGRVRKEIRALLTVIPLLEDDQPVSDVVEQLLLASSKTVVDSPHNDMAQLELYYPFVRHLRMSERADVDEQSA